MAEPKKPALWRSPNDTIPYQKQMMKVPIIGEWYGRIGRIHSYMIAPCAFSPIAVFEAAVVSAPRLLYSLFGPDCYDDAWDFLKGKGKGHRRAPIFKTRGRGNPMGEVSKGIQKFIIPIGDFAQRVGWYMSLVDATTEGLVNWTSLMYQYSGCTGSDTPYAQADAGTGIAVFPISGPHCTFDGWINRKDREFSMGFSGCTVPGGFNPGFTWNLQTSPPPFGGLQAEWTGRIVRGGGEPIGPPVTPTRGADGNLSASWSDFSAYADKDGGNYRLELNITSGVFWSIGGHFLAYGAHPRDTQIGIKPSKCDPVGGAFKYLDENT